MPFTLALLPWDKFEHIITLLDTWPSKQYCLRKELESLIGNLQHAFKFIPQGRTFLRRMINLLATFWRNDHLIRVKREFCLDLLWCREFFYSWHGLSFLFYPNWAPLPEFCFSSDLAGAQGYGALFDHEWFVGKWWASQLPLSRAYDELFPVVISAALWGH